jgi:hypothetical protein
VKTSVCWEDAATAANEGDASSSIGGQEVVAVALEMRETALARPLGLLGGWSVEEDEDEDVNWWRLCKAGSSS